jgi:pyruvate formate lyase activating enzyme
MSLADYLDQLSAPGKLVEKLDGNSVRCTACAHHCRIGEGKRGVCKVRFNQGGTLRVPAGYVSSLQVDPIEKKPFYHFMAGSNALTFGMLGCNFHCGFCQNWLTSQALREDESEMLSRYIQEMSPDEIVQVGVQNQAKVVASSYNEPLITSEWSHEIFSEGKNAGLHPVYVSNGFATPQVLEYLHPVLEGFKVDLKTMQDERYQELGGRLQPVLDSIQVGFDLGFWVEIVTLVVPGFNDSESELEEMASFIKSVSPEIPWHVTAFRPDYKMTDKPRTSAASLRRAVEIGKQEGLLYVYGGNMPGSLGEFEHTRCHQCQEILIRRIGFAVQEYSITADGTCPDCGASIPGVWTGNPEQLSRSRGYYPRII